MQAHDMPQNDGESKVSQLSTHKFWLAMVKEVRQHPVVGYGAKSMKPAAPKKPTWRPFEMWFWLLCEAAHQPRTRVLQGRAIALNRGQLAVSYRFIAGEANWGIKAARLFFERLERFKMITLSVSAGTQLALNFSQLPHNSAEKGTGYTIVSICNYDRYQHSHASRGTAGAQQGHSRGTAGAQDSTKYIDTKDSQSGGSSGRSYWQSALNPGLGDIQYVDGRLTLGGETYDRWLQEFDGDARRLGLAIGEIHVEPNSTVPISVQVERKLSRICRDALERDKRAAAAIGSRNRTRSSNPKADANAAFDAALKKRSATR